MAPGPSSSRYFSLATASPKLVQTTDNDLINKLSSDESSSDSSSSESPAPTPPPNQPRIPSSGTGLFELEPPAASAEALAPPTSTSQGVSTDLSLQRHLLLSTSSIPSELTSPVLKRDRDHRVTDMGGFMIPTQQRDVKSGGGSGTDHMVGGGSLKMIDDDHHSLLKVTCTSYSALSPSASFATGGGAAYNSSSAPQSVPFPCAEMLPKIFEAPVSALISSTVATTPIPPDIDTLISTVAGSNTSPKFKQGHPQMPNDGLFVNLSSTPAPPPPPPMPPGSLMDDVVSIAASPGVKILGASSEQSAPVRLLPDLPQQPVKDLHHQPQVRILPNTRAMPSSEAVQLMPDGQVNQVYDAGLSVSPLAVQDQMHQQHPHAGQALPGSALSTLPPPPNDAAAPQVKLIPPEAMQTQQQQPPLQPAQAAVMSRTIVVSGVEPIYVPAVGTASENKFVTSLMPPPASLSVSSAPARPTNPVLRPVKRAASGKKQVVTLVSDLSLLEPLKPEPPIGPTPLSTSSAGGGGSGTQAVYLRPVFPADSEGVVTSVPPPHVQRPLSVQPLPPPMPSPQLQSPKTRKERPNLMKKVTPISCFKCQVCGFLGLTNKAVEDHMMLEHDADLSDDGGDDSWLSVAQKEGIKLECSFCPNKFNAEGSRSFKVHVIDDHGVNEAEAEKHFRDRYAQRKAVTLAFIKKKREEEREERRRCRKDGLEAYVDEHGELRVRSTRRSAKKRKGKKSEVPSFGEGVNQGIGDNEKVEEAAGSVDVSAKEYVAAIDVARRMEKAKKGGDEVKVKPDDKQKTLIEMTQRHKRKRLKKEPLGDSDSSSEEGNDREGAGAGEDVGGDIDIVNVPGTSAAAMPPCSPKKRAGRPRGARSIGLTRLRRMNPNIKLSDDHMGSECGVDGCGVRLKELDNMEYHRRCHVEGGGGDDGGGPKEKRRPLACPECPETFSMWALLAQHLWRAHRVDMELHSCPQCTFKSYYLNTLNLHLQRHQTERPFLCDECGKRFKAEKSLKAHLRTACAGAGGAEGAGGGGEANGPKEEVPAKEAVRCGVCHRDFKNVRRLRDHMASVHEKLKPFLCSSCPYSGERHITCTHM